MAIPSAKYAVDYTDSYGFKWTKSIETLYPALGALDESIALSKYNADIMKTVYRKSTQYNALYDNSVTISSMPGRSPDVLKYYARNNYPSYGVNINTVIVNNASPDGNAYSIGTNEDASSVLNRGAGSYRLLVDAEYNKILFRVNVREMSFTTHSSPIQKNLYDDPTWTDIPIGDVDDSKYYAIFYHSSAKVWNGSSWSEGYIAPMLMATGEINQTFTGGGSAFNNLFTNYPMDYGSGANINLTNTSSNYFWTANNFQAGMYNDRYTLAWSDNFDYKPSFADEPGPAYEYCRQWMIDNGVQPYNDVNFELSREVKQISEDAVVLVTVMCTCQLTNDNSLYMRYCNTYTFPMIKGSSMSKFIAGFGLYYLADNNADLTGITPTNLSDSSDIWLGEMSADGTTTGNWIKGNDIADYTGYNKDGNIINPDYDPSGGGGSDEDNYDDMGIGTGGNVGGLSSYAIMTLNDLADLIADFNSNLEPGQSVVNNFICCYKLGPLSSFICTTGSHNIIMSAYSTSGNNFVSQRADYAVISSQKSNVPLGTYKVPRKTNTFYDFSPYSTYELFIPCCGWIPLPDTVAGRTIDVYLLVDVASCSCKGVVRISGTTIAEVSGVIGSSVPFYVNDSGLARASIVQGIAQTMSSLIVGGVSAGSGNAMGASMGITNALQSAQQVAIAGNTNYTAVRGTNGDMTAYGNGEYCCIKITHPIVDPVVNEYLFGHTIGYLCNTVGALSSFHGFTKCENPHVHISATSTEKEEIKQLLEQGVILP